MNRIGHVEFTVRSMKRLEKAWPHVRGETQDLALRDSVLEDPGALAFAAEEQF